MFLSIALLGASALSAQAPSFTVERVVTGRLVDVHALVADGSAALRPALRDVLVDPELASDGRDFRLETHPVTGVERLVVLRKAGSAFDALVERARSARTVHEVLGMPGELPRDAAVALRFGGALAARAPAAELVDVQVDGAPWSGRVLYEPGAAGLVVDFGSSPLPAGADVAIELRGAAEPAAGRFAAVRSRTGGALVGETRFAFRTGHGPASTLADEDGPQVVGEQAIRVFAAEEIDHPDFEEGFAFRVGVRFRQLACVQEPAVGDMLGLPAPAGLLHVFRAERTASPNTVILLVVAFAPDPLDAADLIGVGTYLSPYDVGDVPECFVRFDPLPGPVPAEGVDPAGTVEVVFNETMDAGSVQALDSLMISRVREEPSFGQIVPAAVEVLGNATRFVLHPLLPLDHQQGIAEPYYLLTNDGNQPMTDLAGNELAVDLPIVRFTLDPAAPSESNASVALVFDDQDENGDGAPELRGQVLFDLDEGLLLARPVSRFTASTERFQPVPALMTPHTKKVNTPLSPLGSKLMAVWRYCDFSFSLTQEFFYDLDVEGLAWAPLNGQVFADQYDEFEIALTHANRLPDEHLGATSNLPDYPQSGLLKGTYESIGPVGNLLNDPQAGLTVVHPREKGYAVDPTKTFEGPGGSTMLRYPLNQDPDPSDDAYFTWRDTSIATRGAPDGVGADPHVLVSAGLIPPGEEGGVFPKNQVPSIGLPLLMQFSCFPTDGGLGLNSFDVSVAVNSSGQPNFRLFSTGGIDSGGNVVVKNPDDEDKSTGGFDPTQGGAKTKGFDNVFYHGATDFVVRVSRAHSIWFDAHVPSRFAGPVVEPSPDGMPAGTNVQVAFRGALDVPETVPGSASDADTYDPYGNPTPDSGWGGFLNPVEYLNDDPSWLDSLEGLEGARFVQMRITLVSNAASGDAALLSAVAYGHEPL